MSRKSRESKNHNAYKVRPDEIRGLTPAQRRSLKAWIRRVKHTQHEAFTPELKHLTALVNRCNMVVHDVGLLDDRHAAERSLRVARNLGMDNNGFHVAATATLPGTTFQIEFRVPHGDRQQALLERIGLSYLYTDKASFKNEELKQLEKTLAQVAELTPDAYASAEMRATQEEHLEAWGLPPDRKE